MRAARGDQRHIEVLRPFPVLSLLVTRYGRRRFNKALWHIRDRVRTSLETEATFQNRRNNPEVLLTRVIQPDDPEIAKVEDGIILEKLNQHLTPRQREFVQIRLQVDTDKEAAERMRITPEAVSQIKSGITRTATEMLRNG